MAKRDYTEAVGLVASRKMSGVSAARKFDLSYQYLMQRVSATLKPAEPAGDTAALIAEIKALKKSLETAEHVKTLLETQLDERDAEITKLEEELSALKPTKPAPTRSPLGVLKFKEEPEYDEDEVIEDDLTHSDIQNLLKLQAEANRTNAEYRADPTPEKLAAAKAAAEALDAA